MNDVEIEKKYKITKEIYDEIIEYFKQEKVEAREELQNDIYFSPMHFPFFGGEIDNECLRIRVLGQKNILGYKKFIPATEGKPAHCIEHELEISDINKLKLILEDLRILEAFTLKKERKSFIYNQDVEVSLDIVDNLGFFIELEVVNKQNLACSLHTMNRFTTQFGITEEMRNYDGYAYLLFNKNSRLGKK